MYLWRTLPTLVLPPLILQPNPFLNRSLINIPNSHFFHHFDSTSLILVSDPLTKTNYTTRDDSRSHHQEQIGETNLIV